MPNIFAVIGVAVRSAPIIGAIVDVPAFRDPGPGREAQKRAQNSSGGGGPQGNRPAYTPPSREVQEQRWAQERMIREAAMAPRSAPQPAPAPRPTLVAKAHPLPAPATSKPKYAALGINEGDELAALPLEPIVIPKPSYPMPVMVSRHATDFEKQKCWEKTIGHGLMGAGTGLAGGLVGAQIGCFIVPGPWTIACKIGAYVLTTVGGAAALGLDAHADYCLTPPPKQE